jgi:glycosyltransferase involved in cell wall biosynthesis
MASGLPVIGTRVEGLEELLTGTGVLVDEPYARGFADEIERLASRHDELIRLSGQSVKKAKRYGWTSFVDALLEVYRKNI